MQNSNKWAISPKAKSRTSAVASSRLLVIYSQCKVSRNSKFTTNNLVYIWDSSLICTKFYLSSRWQIPPTKKTEAQQYFLKWPCYPNASCVPSVLDQASARLICHPSLHPHQSLRSQGLRIRPTVCRASPSPWLAWCLDYSWPLHFPHWFGENGSLCDIESSHLWTWNISLITQVFLITHHFLRFILRYLCSDATVNSIFKKTMF